MNLLALRKIEGAQAIAVVHQPSLTGLNKLPQDPLLIGSHVHQHPAPTPPGIQQYGEPAQVLFAYYCVIAY